MLKKYGRSLSICVMQIADGRMKEEDVEMIVSSTSFETRESLLEGIRLYSECYWSGDVEKCKAIALRFWDEGKLFQPRLGDDSFSQAIHIGGVWVNSLEECVYNTEEWFC